jgi:hypothetical protein
LENGQKVVELAQGTLVTFESIVDGLAAKKAVLDSLPVANLTALITQDIKEAHAATIKMANAMLENGPVCFCHSLYQYSLILVVVG